MSSDPLARVRILLDGDSSSFEQSVRNADERAQSHFDNIKSNAALMGTAIAASATAAAFGLVAMAKDSALAVIETEKLAQMAGVTASEMSVLQFAGQKIGMEFDRTGDVVMDFNERIADARLGNTDAANAFEALNVKIVDSKGNLRDAVSVMSDVADRFSEMEDGATKNLIATRLGGDAFREFIPFLNQGAKGLSEARDEAENLGLTLESEAVAAAHNFNDALNVTHITTMAFKNRLLTELMPSVTGVIQEFNSLAVQSTTLDSFIASVSGTLQWLARNLDLVSDAAMVGGVVIATTRIRALTVATYESVKASFDKSVAEARATAAEIARTGSLLRVARAQAAAASSDLLAARAAVASASTTSQQTAASLRLAEAKIAEAAATRVATAAENTHTAAKTAGRMSVAGLLGVLTGPAGLAVTVGAVAAGYLLMRNNSESARSAVERMTGSVREQVGELKKLNLARRQDALEQAQLTIKETKSNLEAAALDRKDTFGYRTRGARTRGNLDLFDHGFASNADKAAELDKKLRAGEITRDKFYNEVRNLPGLTTKGKQAVDEYYNAFSDGIDSMQNAYTTIKAVNQLKDETGAKAGAAAGQVTSSLNALDNAETKSAKKVKEKAEKVDSLTSSYNSQIASLSEQIALVGKTGDLAKISYDLEFGSLSRLNTEQKQRILYLAKELDLRKSDQAYQTHLKALDQEITQLKTIDPIQRQLKELELRKYAEVLPAQRELLLSREREILLLKEYQGLLGDIKEPKSIDALKAKIDALNGALQSGAIDTNAVIKKELSAFPESVPVKVNADLDALEKIKSTFSHVLSWSKQAVGLLNEQVATSVNQTIETTQQAAYSLQLPKGKAIAIDIEITHFDDVIETLNAMRERELAALKSDLSQKMISQSDYQQKLLDMESDFINKRLLAEQSVQAVKIDQVQQAVELSRSGLDQQYQQAEVFAERVQNLNLNKEAVFTARVEATNLGQVQTALDEIQRIETEKLQAQLQAKELSEVAYQERSLQLQNSFNAKRLEAEQLFATTVEAIEAQGGNNLAQTFDRKKDQLQAYQEQMLAILSESTNLGDFKYEAPSTEEEKIAKAGADLELAYQHEKEIRQTLFDDRKITKEQQLLSLSALDQQYHDQKRQIEAASEAQAQIKTKKDRATMVNFYQQGLDAIANSNSKHAKKAKEVQKAMALYQIAKDTKAAAIASYKALAGIPIIGPGLGFAAAAAAVAFGAAQAKAVMSDSDSAASAGSASTPSASVTPNAEQPSLPTQATTIQIPSDTLFTGRQMIDLLNEAISDGKRLNADAISFIGT